MKHAYRLKAIERKAPAVQAPVVFIYSHDGKRDPGQPDPPPGSHVIFYDIISRKAKSAHR